MTPFEHLEMLVRLSHSDLLEWCEDYGTLITTRGWADVQQYFHPLIEACDEESWGRIGDSSISIALSRHQDDPAGIRTNTRQLIAEIGAISDVPAVQEAYEALFE